MRAAAYLLALHAAGGAIAFAQHATPQLAEPPLASVSGKVETPGKDRQLPIANVMVTLHRVGSDTSGAVDSVRSDAAGNFSLHYRRTGAPDAIYFAAAVYRGIAYFSAPLKSANARGEEGEITVFDTTSRPVEFHVQGHHLVVGSPRPTGLRDIVEVWELSNDTTVTVVGRDSAAPVWTAPLPAGATALAGGQGDVPSDAIVLRGGRVALLAAFGPGVKQISYSYALPPSAFPLKIRGEHSASVFEILLEEPAARIIGGPLKAMDAATTQGRTFKRFLGQDVAKDANIEIVVPASTAAARQNVVIAIAAVIVLAMGSALARAFRWRPATSSHLGAAPREDAASMLAAIALLDAQYERGESNFDDAEYAARRATLKAGLQAALVSEGRAP